MPVLRGAAAQPCVLRDAESQLEATFVPDAGMVCSSVRHDGEELLAQRDGVQAYAERGATMGIPLLYPWANRLAGFRYEACGRAVDLATTRLSLPIDANGLPIHGVIPGRLPWNVRRSDGAMQLRGELQWRSDELLSVFPFAHTLFYEAQLAKGQLTIVTTVYAGAGTPVPVSFGYHPYLTLPGSDRSTWRVELAATEHLELDGQMIPTGRREPYREQRFELGQSAWDDAFTGLTQSRVFSVAARDRHIRLKFLERYPYAQVYAPPGEQFICFEPMTAPTNALKSGRDLPVVAAGKSFAAGFRISVGRPLTGRPVAPDGAVR